MIASDRLMSASSPSAGRAPKLTAWSATALMPTTPWSFFRSSAWKMRLNALTVPVVTCHMSLTAVFADSPGETPTERTA